MPRNFNPLRSPQRLVRTILGVLVAANLVAAGFVMFPPGGSAEDLDRQYASLQAQVQSKQALLERSRQHAAAIEKGRSEGEQFLGDYFLASRTHMSTLLSELDTAANDAKIKPRDHVYNIEPIEGSDSLRMLTIGASYEGSYADLKRFVHEIDASPRLLIIESLNAAPQQGSGSLIVTMKLDAFVRDDGEQAP